MPAVLCENRTKAALDQALRQLLPVKPLDQIRVREVTELCAIRRQSFYYHFPDIYALFDWSLSQEQAALLDRQARCLTWQQAMADLLDHTAESRPYYRALLRHRGRAGLRALLGPVLDRSLAPALDYYLRRCGGASDQPAALDTWRSLLLTLLESWLWDGSRDTRRTLDALDDMIRRGSLGAAWQNLPAQPHWPEF